MIANTTELMVALRQLKIMEHALKALRDQLDTANPALLDITEKAYVRRIAKLQVDLSHLTEPPTG